MPDLTGEDVPRHDGDVRVVLPEDHTLTLGEQDQSLGAESLVGVVVPEGLVHHNETDAHHVLSGRPEDRNAERVDLVLNLEAAPEDRLLRLANGDRRRRFPVKAARLPVEYPRKKHLKNPHVSSCSNSDGLSTHEHILVEKKYSTKKAKSQSFWPKN